MSELKPGMELDALVAEKVMGWELNEERTLYRKPEEPFWRGLIFEPDGPFRGDDGQPGWSPSTDISAAWEVVEKLRDDIPKIAKEKGATFCIEDAIGEWWAGFKNSQWSGEGIFAETAPLAICLAALKAIGK